MTPTIFAIGSGLALAALCHCIATTPGMSVFERAGTCSVFIAAYAGLMALTPGV